MLLLGDFVFARATRSPPARRDRADGAEQARGPRDQTKLSCCYREVRQPGIAAKRAALLAVILNREISGNQMPDISKSNASPSGVSPSNATPKSRIALLAVISQWRAPSGPSGRGSRQSRPARRRPTPMPPPRSAGVDLPTANHMLRHRSLTSRAPPVSLVCVPTSNHCLFVLIVGLVCAERIQGLIIPAGMTVLAREPAADAASRQDG